MWYRWNCSQASRSEIFIKKYFLWNLFSTHPISHQDQDARLLKLFQNLSKSLSLQLRQNKCMCCQYEMPLPQCTGVTFNETNNTSPSGDVLPSSRAAVILRWLVPGWGWVSREWKSEERCLRLPWEQRSISSQINGYCEPGRKATRCDKLNQTALAVSHLWNRLVWGEPTWGVFALDGEISAAITAITNLTMKDEREERSQGRQ